MREERGPPDEGQLLRFRREAASDHILLPTETALEGLPRPEALTPSTPSLPASPGTPAGPPPARRAPWSAIAGATALALAVIGAAVLIPGAGDDRADVDPSSVRLEHPRRGGHLRMGTLNKPGRWTFNSSLATMHIHALETLRFDRLVELGPSESF